VVLENNNHIALYDEVQVAEPRLDFIYKMTGHRPGIYLNKQRLLNFNLKWIDKMALVLVYTPITLIFMPFMLSKRRALVALLIHEIHEQAIIMLICKKYQIKHLYYSCIFEKDSNAAAYLLQKSNIYITKNPSEDPLYYHNQIIIADELGICNDYQWEEINAYKATMFVNKFSQWLPERFEYIKKINRVVKADAKNVIGLYSSGVWLDKYLDNNLTYKAYDSYTAREELEVYLKEFIITNPNYKLKIFLHPMEKKKEYSEIVKRYYKEKFQNIPHTFADIECETMNMFDECEVAISVFSGILIYRFYAGMKGYFYNPHFPNFPILDSTFQNICIKDKTQLFQELKEAMLMDALSFNKFKLKGHFNYDKSLEKIQQQLAS